MKQDEGSRPTRLFFLHRHFPPVVLLLLKEFLGNGRLLALGKARPPRREAREREVADCGRRAGLRAKGGRRKPPGGSSEHIGDVRREDGGIGA